MKRSQYSSSETILHHNLSRVSAAPAADFRSVFHDEPHSHETVRAVSESRIRQTPDAMQYHIIYYYNNIVNKIKETKNRYLVSAVYNVFLHQ